MSVKINGIKFLNENNYEKIIINQEEENYHVNVKQSNNIINVDKNINLSKELRVLTDNEKIRKIINHYLESSTINGFIDNVAIPYYDNVFTFVKGSRDLYCHLSYELFNDVISDIKEKYYLDREKTLNNNKEIKTYYIKMSSYSSYNIVQDEYKGKYMELNLLSNKNSTNRLDSLNEKEEEFLRGFLVEKFNSIGGEVELENKNLNNEEDEAYINLGYYIDCGDIVIDIDNVELFPTIIGAIDDYNKNKEKVKKLGGK